MWRPKVVDDINSADPGDICLEFNPLGQTVIVYIKLFNGRVCQADFFNSDIKVDRKVSKDWGIDLEIIKEKRREYFENSGDNFPIGPGGKFWPYSECND